MSSVDRFYSKTWASGTESEGREVFASYVGCAESGILTGPRCKHILKLLQLLSG